MTPHSRGKERMSSVGCLIYHFLPQQKRQTVAHRLIYICKYTCNYHILLTTTVFLSCNLYINGCLVLTVQLISLYFIISRLTLALFLFCSLSFIIVIVLWQQMKCHYIEFNWIDCFQHSGQHQNIITLQSWCTTCLFGCLQNIWHPITGSRHTGSKLSLNTRLLVCLLNMYVCLLN